MSTEKATGMGFRELFALTSPWSVAKSQEVKARPYSTTVSMLLPSASVTAPKRSHRQYVVDMNRKGDLDKEETGRYEIFS